MPIADRGGQLGEMRRIGTGDRCDKSILGGDGTTFRIFDRAVAGVACIVPGHRGVVIGEGCGRIHPVTPGKNLRPGSADQVDK